MSDDRAGDPRDARPSRGSTPPDLPSEPSPVVSEPAPEAQPPTAPEPTVLEPQQTALEPNVSPSVSETLAVEDVPSKAPPPEVAPPEVKPPEELREPDISSTPISPPADVAASSRSEQVPLPPPRERVPLPSLTNIASIPVVDDAARARAYASVIKKKEARLLRLMEFVQKRGTVRNADIVRLLRVSRASAHRYARILVLRGVLKVEGRGRSCAYSMV